MKKTVKTTRPAKTAASPAPPKAAAPPRASTQSETPASPPPKKRAAPRKSAAKTKPVVATPAPTPIVTPPPAAPKPEAPAKLPIPGGAPLKPTPPPTLIHAQIDVGFGNTLHIRGDGPGLSWHGGLAMVPVAANLWSFTVRGATAPFAFKVLVNDLTWNEGENYLIAPGTEITVMPVFP
jgi:hypothetical protein